MNRKMFPAPRALRFVPTLILAFLCCATFQAQPVVDTPKPAETDQSRIERGKALLAAHQLETAATELESVRAATKDPALRNISSVMLMNAYLEAGNYTRAEALLDESFGSGAARDEDSLRTYFALAGQAVNGARGHLSRYRSFGINVADANLQPEAAQDLNRLRSLIERMVVQAKTVASDRKAYDSLSLLEDVLGLRVALAKDADDQAAWSAEYASVREVLASSKTQVASLGAIPVLPSKKSAVGPTPQTESNHVADNTSPRQPEQSSTGAPSAAKNDVANSIDKGPLNLIASKRVLPHYPQVARQVGMVGMVRVYVVLDENGRVIDVPKSEGPGLLRTAAETAARQWIFAPTSSEGKPVRVRGYLDFNFTL